MWSHCEKTRDSGSYISHHAYLPEGSQISYLIRLSFLVYKAKYFLWVGWLWGSSTLIQYMVLGLDHARSAHTTTMFLEECDSTVSSRMTLHLTEIRPPILWILFPNFCFLTFPNLTWYDYFFNTLKEHIPDGSSGDLTVNNKFPAGKAKSQWLGKV
jgi:hypothetical protein